MTDFFNADDFVTILCVDFNSGRVKNVCSFDYVLCNFNCYFTLRQAWDAAKRRTQAETCANNSAWW